eukprot:scaffold3614_cov123-Isochrysis_galbana.AAC.9
MRDAAWAYMGTNTHIWLLVVAREGEGRPAVPATSHKPQGRGGKGQRGNTLPGPGKSSTRLSACAHARMQPNCNLNKN